MRSCHAPSAATAQPLPQYCGEFWLNARVTKLLSLMWFHSNLDGISLSLSPGSVPLRRIAA